MYYRGGYGPVETFRAGGAGVGGGTTIPLVRFSFFDASPPSDLRKQFAGTAPRESKRPSLFHVHDWQGGTSARTPPVDDELTIDWRCAYGGCVSKIQ